MTDAYELEELITIRDWEMDDNVTDDPIEWFREQLEDIALEELNAALKERVADNVDRDAPEDWNCQPNALDDIIAQDVVDDAVMTDLDNAGVFEAFLHSADQEWFEEAESMRQYSREHAVSVVEDKLQVYDKELGEKDLEDEDDFLTGALLEGSADYQKVLDELNEDQNALDQGEELDAKTLEVYKARLERALKGLPISTYDTAINKACNIVDSWNRRPIKNDIKPAPDKDEDEDKRKGKKQDRVNWVYNAVSRDIKEEWVSQSQEVFVRVVVERRDDGDNKTQVHRVNADQETPFHAYVADKWRDRIGDVPMETDVKQVTKYVITDCLHRANTGSLEVREMATQMYHRQDGKIDQFLYYAGDEQDLVVDDTGVRYQPSKGHFRPNDELAPYHFERTGVDRTIRQVLSDVTTLNAKQAYLMAPMIPAFLVPDANKPITHFRGPSGSGKSSTSKFLKLVLSPEENAVKEPLKQGGNLPNDTDDLKTTCKNSNTLLFDNEKYIDGETQDLMCNIVTGGTFKKRKLYTDSQQVSYQLHNHFILNYISLSFMQDDFANRSLLFDLSRIDEENTLTDREWKDKARQGYKDIQSLAFETLSDAFKQSREDINDLPDAPGLHLNDFYEWCIRCASVMDYDVERYAQRLTALKESSEMASVQDSDFASQVIEYISTSDEPVKGTASDIHKEFQDEFTHWGDNFPSGPSTMGKRIQNRMKGRLESGANITVKTTKSRGVTQYTIFDRTNPQHTALVEGYVDKEQVWEAIQKHKDGQRGAPVGDVLDEFNGADRDRAEQKIDEMKDSDIFEPQAGRIDILT